MTKEDKRLYDAERYKGHREEMLARNARYQAAHRDEICAYMAAYRDANGDATRETRRQKRAEFCEWLQVLRANNGCVDCKTHEGRLEHHHVDPSTKMYDVSRMYLSSLDTLEAELEKCDVLCKPCHQNIT